MSSIACFRAPLVCAMLMTRVALGQGAAADPGAPTVKLADFVVTPSRFGIADQRVVAPATLTSGDLELLPQIGDDLYRSISRLPGLATNDFTARFWVRGAPNGELLARLDGVDLIEPFHLKDVDGALSLVDPAVIGQLELSSGGFSAEFGNKLAGVLSLETKEPARPRTSIGLSLTGVGGTHQGITAGRGARWLASARRGYPDVALRLAGRDDEVDPRYYDVSGKFEYEPTPDHRVSVHALHAGDTLRYHRSGNPDLRSAYDSDYLWGRWRGTPTPGRSGEAVLSYARLTWHRAGAGTLDGFPFSLRDRRQLETVGLRNEWTAVVNDQSLVRAGVEANTGSADYDYALSHQHTVVSAGRQVTVTDRVDTALDPSGHRTAAFAAVRWQPWTVLVLEPGLRHERQNFTRDAEWNPRFNAALSLGPATLRAAWGRYSQMQALHELAVADADPVFHPAERAEHRVLSLERSLGNRMLARVELYERIGTNLRPRHENLDHAYDLFPEAQSDRVLLAPARGRARGLEFLVSRRTGDRWAWNASYALSRAEEKIAGAWVPRARDQRHAIYADATYAPNARWQFSAAWQFHTGWPTTDVVYSLATLTNGRRVTVSANGAPYGLRLPDYHRLDLRATRRWTLRHGELRAFVDVFNVYDRVNLIGYDHRVAIADTRLIVTPKPREQLPLLPSIGAEWEF